MIELIKLNLLPYREIAREKKQKKFKIILLLGLATGVVLALLGYLALAGAISNQNSRNQFLKEQTAILDKQIAEVKDYEAKKKNFLARKKKIEELQNDRFKLARILDDMNRMLPDGVYLTAIDPTPTSYVLSGKAISDNRTAMFMTTLPSSGIFQLPALKSIKKEGDSQSFQLEAPFIILNEKANAPVTNQNVLDAGVNKDGK